MTKVGRKYCPLFTMAGASIGLDTPQSCMGASCAWYSAKEYECALVAISNHIARPEVFQMPVMEIK